MSTLTSTALPIRVKTRILILSDTHSALPYDANTIETNRLPKSTFSKPLPECDVLLHCGDLTMVGLEKEYAKTLNFLAAAPTKHKLVIAGNHDISLDEDYYSRNGMSMQRLKEPDPDMPRRVKAMMTGEEAQKHGIYYLEEGVHEFLLQNGAKLRVYASPYQPEFCDWAFPYWRNEDRYNPPHLATPYAKPIAVNPVPDFPNIDIMMTHGPPLGIRDKVTSGESVGCQHLLRAANRARPLLHCFGHIHEAWGCERVRWNDEEVSRAKDMIGSSEPVEATKEPVAEVNVSVEGGKPLVRGRETLMVNASIMTITYKPQQSAWLVELDLEKA